MSKIRLQDLTAIINNTSRFGLSYDLVHVETLIVTEEPIPTDSCWYVPSGASVPPEVLQFFNATNLSNLPLYPIKEEKILAGTEDIRKQAEEGNLQEVMSDAARYMLRAVMKKTPLIPQAGSPNVYMVTYDYKIYPVAENTFEFKFILPFDGLELSTQGGRVQTSIITPIGANINPNGTYGKAQDGTEITEYIADIQNTNRKIVSFYYQIDPEFVVQYNY